ncbi:hypothetical protein CSB11_03045 [Candidatus Campbellbacteria bacterium]|nr:MAG: hypothetical protein CSB11_03045 [Candidatus Campbellbacteria bacterium]
MNLTNDITYFAKTNTRGKQVEFGIKDEDRLRHVYVIGKTGMGKSTLFENMAVQDILKGNGMCFLDPHGSAIETFLEQIPKERIQDVIYFAPFDTQNPIAFNVLDSTNLDANKRFLTAQGLLAAFKKIFGEETFSDRMVHILNNSLLALLEYDGATLLSVTRLLTDAGYRDDVIQQITDPAVKAFWVNEYNAWDDKFRKEASAAILNKLGQFTSNPLIRNIVGQEYNSIDFRQIMDDKKILLINLSKGQVGEDNANLLGAMLTTKIYLAAMGRADMAKSDLKKAPNFYLYIDEFQNVVNDSFASILSEARKYKLSLLMAHQYVEQMPETVRAAIFGNVGTTISFRVGPEDAEIIEKLFYPTFEATDIVNLGRFEIYLSLMIDGIGSAPFSATTLPPIEPDKTTYQQEAIEYSRKVYGRNRQEVEEKIFAWLEKKYKTTSEKKKDEKWKQKKIEKYGDKAILSKDDYQKAQSQNSKLENQEKQNNKKPEKNFENKVKNQSKSKKDFSQKKENPNLEKIIQEEKELQKKEEMLKRILDLEEKIEKQRLKNLEIEKTREQKQEKEFQEVLVQKAQTENNQEKSNYQAEENQVQNLKTPKKPKAGKYNSFSDAFSHLKK